MLMKFTPGRPFKVTKVSKAFQTSLFFAGQKMKVAKKRKCILSFCADFFYFKFYILQLCSDGK